VKTVKIEVLSPALPGSHGYWFVVSNGNRRRFNNSPKGRAALEDHVLELLGELQRGVPAAEERSSDGD
jgi:hypothetical protein